MGDIVHNSHGKNRGGGVGLYFITQHVVWDFLASSVETSAE